MSVLNDYQVRFSHHPRVGKTLSTNNEWLSAYISDHYTIDEVNRLLDGINKVLRAQIPLAGGETQSLYLANITASETKIYEDSETWQQNNNISPDCTLPTPHFKIIVEAWKNYLED